MAKVCDRCGKILTPYKKFKYTLTLKSEPAPDRDWNHPPKGTCKTKEICSMCVLEIDSSFKH